MSDYLPFIVIGVTTGAVYALASMGLVLTYVTSGHFNFAHGAIGMFATYIFYSLRVDVGLPTPLAIAIAVGVVAPLMGAATDRILLRHIDRASPAASVAATVGLLVALQGLAIALYGAETRQVAPLFPRSTYRLPGVNVGIDQTLVVVIAVGVGLALAVGMARTRFGLNARAVVDNAELAALSGLNAARVTTTAWMVSSALAALAGILFAPFVQLDSIALTLLVVQAFGAAAVGRLTNLRVTSLAAFAIGIGGALAAKWAATTPALVGLPTSLPFLVLFGVLVIYLRGSFGPTERPDHRPGAPTGRPAVTIAVAAVLAALLPAVLPSSRMITATQTVAFVVVFASLSLLLGTSRQLSLCHAVFVVFGATNAAHLLDAGLPWPVAVLAGAAVMVPVGAALAVPAIRLSGLLLALATFGFGVLCQYLLFSAGLSFGADALAFIGRPAGFAGDDGFFYLVLAIAVAVAVVVEWVRASRLGLTLRAVADSQTGAASIGIEPTTSRVLVFCLSAFLASIGGALIGTAVGTVTPTSFDFFQSLVWAALLVATGPRTIGGSILAAIVLVALPATMTEGQFVEWLPVAFGVAAVIAARAPNGVAGVVSGATGERLAAQSAARTPRRHRARVASAGAA